MMPMLNPNFEIVKVDDIRGKIMIAKRNFLPGELIFTEEAPILSVVSWKGQTWTERYLLAYEEFLKLDTKDRSRFLSLYGDTNDAIVESYSSHIRDVSNDVIHTDGEKMLGDQEIELSHGQSGWHSQIKSF